jgi:hypothetical protein
MKIKISLDGVGKPYESLVQKELDRNGLPGCFGSMSPPVLVREQVVESNKLFTPINDIPQDEIVTDTLFVLNKIPEGFALRKDDIDHIERYKANMARHYADRLKACSICQLFDRCDRISQHYETAVRIRESINKDI